MRAAARTDTAVDLNERVDTTKAAVWALVAALALALHVALAAPVAGPQLYGLLAVLGFGLLLPPIAILHARFSAIGPHTAILATAAGVATSVVGIGALALDDLEPGALFFLSMWWWVVGKFSVETGLYARPFGYATMLGSLVAFVAMVGDVLGIGRWTWTLPRLVLAVWLVVLAALLYQDATGRADAG